MKQQRFIIPILTTAVALILALGSFGFLIRQSIRHDRLLVESEVGKVASFLTEQMLTSSVSDTPPLPDHVRGFALYGSNGRAVTGRGIYPSELDTTRFIPPLHGRTSGIPQERWIREKQGSLLLLRALGGAGMNGAGNRQGRGARAGMQSQGRLFLYLDYDTGVFLFQSRARVFLLLFGALLFIGASASSWIFYRRVRSYERELEEKKILTELGSAARTLTHELKNPLAVISMQEKILRRQFGKDKDLTASLDIIGEETERISDMIDRVRLLLKQPKGRPEPIEPVPLLEERSQRLPFPVTIHDNTQDRSPRIFCDKTLFVSAVENILRNGREAQGSDTPPLSVDVSLLRNSVVISFADAGKGIPYDDKDKVFHPFFTTKQNGFGVGLSLVKSFAENAGGSIECRNRETGGTIFRLTLPLYQKG
ncbi:sensor histidine kinase [Sediminispirochaeta bajacaliforniensis]|uniref:sensor histidine kinase n=1 Tax=Sediminispirochaeta bajacaliforniensis TaxID=148 RepID=UPI00037186C3|nr:HAMP domain-containing sensor histidine kinase [Sediminispirochaeta bajacaliforniensis]